MSMESIDLFSEQSIALRTNEHNHPKNVGSHRGVDNSETCREGRRKGGGGIKKGKTASVHYIKKH